MVIPAEPVKPGPNPNPGPRPVPPVSPAPPPSEIPDPTPQPIGPGSNPDLPPGRAPIPDAPPAPSATGGEALEAAERRRVIEVLAPLYTNLGDWRVEVQRLFDWAKASKESDVLDETILEAVELAKEGIDSEIASFGDAVYEFGDDDPAVAQRLGDLGSAYRNLRLAAEKIGEVIAA